MITSKEIQAALGITSQRVSQLKKELKLLAGEDWFYNDKRELCFTDEAYEEIKNRPANGGARVGAGVKKKVSE